MSKFRKFLFIVLSLAILVTAFTVVALASDGSVAIEKVSANLESFNFDFEEVGAFREANQKGQGAFIVRASDNGNQWIEHCVAPAEDSSENASYLSGTYKANSSYSMKEYPYLAIDFDIMKVTNAYSSAAISAYYYANGKVLDETGEVTATVSQSQVDSVSVYLSAFQSSLPENSMEWAHVTVIYEYHEIDNVDYVGLHVYVNGKSVFKNPTAKAVSLKYDPSIYYYGTFRINNAGGVNTGNVSGYDNWQFNFYNSAYTADEVAVGVYNDSYEMPYGVTVASIGNKVYDKMEDAVAAAQNGDVIKLHSDINNTVSIEKTVIIDTNKYDENGVETGEFYSIECSSTSLVKYKDIPTRGFISFKKEQNSSVEVYWDDCPGIVSDLGYCDCPEGMNDHVMSAFTESVTLNSVPVYPGEYPTFDIVDGVSKRFIGWSYTQGGEAEALRPVTTEDVEMGYIALYPVYEDLFYAYEVTAADGTVKYFLEDEVRDAFASATDGATVKLISDVEIHSTISFNSSITIDFNGYDVLGYSVVEKVYDSTLNENGEYVKGETPISTSGTAMSQIFNFSDANDKTLTIKSSRPGTDIYSATISVTVVTYNGEVVSRSSTTADGCFLYVAIAKRSVVNIYGDGMTVYGSSLIYNENHNNDNLNTVLIDGGTYYNVVSNYRHFIHYFVGGKLTVKNAVFVGNGDGLIRTHSKGNLEAVFENCDILNTDVRVDGSTDVVTLNNCRIWMKKWTGSYGGVLGENTYTTEDLTASKGKVAEGLECIPVEKTYTYTVYSETRIAYDSETLKLTPVFTANTIEVEYKYAVVNPSSGLAEITWLDPYGKVIATSTALKNGLASAPEIKIPAGDGYRAITNVAGWLDAEGNASDLVIGNDDEYVFTAVLPDEADREYTLQLSGAMMNISYYAHLCYNIYVPVVDGIEITKMGNVTSNFPKVLINGVEYYAGKIYCDSAEALDNSNMWLNFSDGTNKYSTNIIVDASLYANTVVRDTASTALEKEAIGTLMRYIEESYKASATGLTDAAKAKLEAFYAMYTPADYVTEYPENEIHTVNEKAIDGLVEYIRYVVYNGSRVGLAVKLTDEAVAAGYSVYFSGIMYGTAYKTSDGIFYSNNSPLRTHVMAKNHNITVIDSSGKAVEREIEGETVVATTDYSLPTYILAVEEQGGNADLAKALYAFGKAVIAYRNSLS